MPLKSDAVRPMGVIDAHQLDLVREICRPLAVEILQGADLRNHILLSCLPNLSPSKVMQAIKEQASRKLLTNFHYLSPKRLPTRWTLPIVEKTVDVCGACCVQKKNF